MSVEHSSRQFAVKHVELTGQNLGIAEAENQASKRVFTKKLKKVIRKTVFIRDFTRFG